MTNSKNKVILTIVVCLTALSFAMSYFVRPHPPKVQIISAEQELPDPHKTYPLDTGLAARISNSYGLPLVLVISEYSQRNATALDSIRGWALQQYQKNGGFLHNVIVDPNTPHVSIVESCFYNLFAAPKFLLEEATLDFVRDTIANFHTTSAYLRFRSDYFDSFGLERESALLLSRYESDKAQIAASVLVSSIFWLAAFVVGMILMLRARPGVRSTKSQRVLAYFWLLMGAYYLSGAWAQNQVVMLVSAIVCGAIGLYIRRPVMFSLGEDTAITMRMIEPSRTLIALGYWLTLSLIATQVMTWIRTGTILDPDPLMLIISAFSGNFLYDPISAKRSISHVTGIVWIIASLWTFREITVGLPGAEVEQELATLNEISPKESIGKPVSK